MKKFYLFCNAGMSTSLLASKMQEVASNYNLPIEVKAFPDSKMTEIVAEHNPDVILLGPQVKYKLRETKEKYEPQGIPVEIIDLKDYGRVDGERVLKFAIKTLKDKEKGN